MDLSKSVTNAVEKVVASGMIEDAVAKSVETTIKRAIEEQLRSYSEFGKQIEAAVTAALTFEPINLPSYNDMIVKLVRQQVKHQLESSLAAQVATKIEDLLEPPPAELKLSKLVEMWVERIRERNDDGCVCYGGDHAKVTLEQDGDGFRFYKIKFWESESDREPTMFVGVSCLRDEAGDPPRGDVYHLRFKSTDVESQMFVENLHGIERMLFQMKAAGKACKLILDDFEGVDLSTESHHD